MVIVMDKRTLQDITALIDTTVDFLQCIKNGDRIEWYRADFILEECQKVSKKLESEPERGSF